MKVVYIFSKELQDWSASCMTHFVRGKKLSQSESFLFFKFLDGSWVFGLAYSLRTPYYSSLQFGQRQTSHASCIRTKHNRKLIIIATDFSLSEKKKNRF